MTESTTLEERLLVAIHDPGADVELLAHEVATSDDAQAYLVSLVGTLTAVSAASKAAARAEALLEHGLAIAAEHDDHDHDSAADTTSTSSTATRSHGSSGDGRS